MSKTISSVYAITHLASQKQYVGSAKNTRRRWERHRSDLKSGKHHSVYLQRAWDKYGSDAFEFKMLLICAPDDLLFYEQRALDILKPEYNIDKVAGSRIGAKHSPETIQKIKAAVAGKHPWKGIGPPRHVIEKARLANLGRRATKPSPNKGRVHSEQSRKRMSDAHKGKPSNMKGRHHSELTRKKISLNRKGKGFGKKLNPEQVIEIRKQLSAGYKQAVIAASCGVDCSTISQINRKKIYSWVGDLP